MPELPEVQTVVNQLNLKLKSEILDRIEIIDPKLSGVAAEKILNYQVKEVVRLGKEIFITLEKGKNIKFLAVHLRMTGVLTVQNLPEPNSRKAIRESSSAILYRKEAGRSLDKPPRVQFYFRKALMDFHDTRRFGTVNVYDVIPAKYQHIMDPMSADFSVSRLQEILDSHKQIKVLLLDQAKIFGIGNIYASEILFDSKIDPFRPANSLDSVEVKRLHHSIVKILTLAIKSKGTTFSDYQDAEGNAGGFQKLLKVYERDKLPCRRCRQPVARQRQAQRSTYFCKNCQK